MFRTCSDCREHLVSVREHIPVKEHTLVRKTFLFFAGIQNTSNECIRRLMCVCVKLACAALAPARLFCWMLYLKCLDGLQPPSPNCSPKTLNPKQNTLAEVWSFNTYRLQHLPHPLQLRVQEKIGEMVIFNHQNSSSIADEAASLPKYDFLPRAKPAIIVICDFNQILSVVRGIDEAVRR